MAETSIYAGFPLPLSTWDSSTRSVVERDVEGEKTGLRSEGQIDGEDSLTSKKRFDCPPLRVVEMTAANSRTGI